MRGVPGHYEDGVKRVILKAPSLESVDAVVNPNFRCALIAESDLVVATCTRFAVGSLARCGSSMEDA